MTTTQKHGATQTGTVHIVRERQIGSHTVLAPICRKFNPMALHFVIETDAAVTCQRCAAKVATRLDPNQPAPPLEGGDHGFTR